MVVKVSIGEASTVALDSAVINGNVVRLVGKRGRP